MVSTGEPLAVIIRAAARRREAVDTADLIWREHSACDQLFAGCIVSDALRRPGQLQGRGVV